MGRERSDFEKDFESGNLDEIKRLRPAAAHKAGVLHLSILANALSGEMSDAISLYDWTNGRAIRLRDADLAAVHFALGVGYTRISEYSKARAFFVKNAGFRRAGARARFFVYQGLGFYRYFCGRYSKSVNWAQKAFGIARQESFRYGTMIAEELLAHALTESGQIRLGRKHLKGALTQARALNHKSLRQSFRLFQLLNEARFGLAADALNQLEHALSKLKPQDTYSRNAVKLELANQWLLRGRADRALAVLDEACDSIYASQNRRQIAQLNFRLAFLTWLRGRRDEALRLIKSAELHLHPEVDLILWQRMRALRTRMTLKPYEEYLWKRKVPLRGEDCIADLYEDVVNGDPKALKAILEGGLLFFLYPLYRLEFNQQALVFDVLPRGLMILDHGHISVVQPGFSRINRRVLEALSYSHQTKQELVENVWNHKYESSRHDALVYTSISKIRSLLGKAGEWIEADEKGYRLRSGVRVQSQEIKAPEPNPPPGARKVQVVMDRNLNFRQLRILSLLDNNKKEWLGVEEVMQNFGVSRATATRDLTELTAKGFLLRQGRARATRYAKGNV